MWLTGMSNSNELDDWAECLASCDDDGDAWCDDPYFYFSQNF